MKWFLTLRSRLLLTYLGLILIGFGGLTWLAGNQISKSITEAFVKNLQVQALVLGSSLTESFEDRRISNGAVAHIKRVANDTQSQVTALGPKGIVWFDSDNTPKGENFSTSPEIRDIIAGESNYYVRANEQSVETIYTAVQVKYEDTVVGFVRLAAPESIPQEDIRRQWFALRMGFLGFSLLGTLISLWLLSTLTRPLKALRNSALRLASGDLTERVELVRRDEIGEVGNAFNQMATQVESMVAEQRAFASNASHELRTPLTTIRLRTEALESGNLDKRTTCQYISEIDDEVQRMSGLVDDLILLSRLDAQRLELGEAQVDLARLVYSVQRDLSSMADNKQIRLIVHEEDEPLPPVQANVNHVQVVIRNLLENAIKYTPTGGSVTTTLKQIGDVVRLQIMDTGQGISQEDLPRIVQRFYRADKARSRRTEGVGLGLALVQSVVDLYGGRLQIESPGIDQGTTVSVSWPC
ncbi:MAG: HAMP domain-containing sensor histidine kinase [Chloroflexota bacterium]